MDATQGPLVNDNDNHLYHQLNLQDLSFDPADDFALVG